MGTQTRRESSNAGAALHIPYGHDAQAICARRTLQAQLPALECARRRIAIEPARASRGLLRRVALRPRVPAFHRCITLHALARNCALHHFDRRSSARGGLTHSGTTLKLPAMQAKV